MKTARELQARRRARTRLKVKARAAGRPRLCVFRSSRNIYAQVIEDGAGVTLASASSIDSRIKGEVANGATIEAASRIGRVIAERAIAAGITEVVFDRGGYRYHGRVKALADAAREGGLKL